MKPASEQRTIYLPAIERSVTLGAYVEAVKVAKANPDKTFKHGLTAWWECTGREISDQFFAGVQDRINQEIPYSQRGNGFQRRRGVHHG